MPENNAGTKLAKAAVFGLVLVWTRKTQSRSFPVAETVKNATIRLAKMDFMLD